MAMELTWSLDYCLACDKQTQGETYCSQSCRLADLEASSTWSAPTSPATTNAASKSGNRNSGFYLSPAINFAAYKPSSASLFPVANQSPSPLTSYFPSHTSSQVAATKTLTPSSSTSSLSSTRSTSSQASPLSEQARSELISYTNSFDSTRNWKRRMTWS